MTDQQKEALDIEWEQLLDRLEQRFDKRPDLQTILFLIGVQELGQLRSSFNKEEKQDLMHIAVCHLLAGEGYFRFSGLDDEGWPHYEVVKSIPVDTKGLITEELLLKKQILLYFGKE